MRKVSWSRIAIAFLLFISLCGNYILWQSAEHDNLEVRLLRANIMPICED